MAIVAEGADFDDVVDQIAELDIAKEDEEQSIDDEPLEDESESLEETEEQEETEEVEEPDFVLDYKGQQLKKTKSELIDLAQKGFAAEKRFDEAAEMRRNVESYAKHLQQQSELQQQLQGEFVKLAQLDAELQRYQNVDWAAYTDQDPVEATKQFQRYQILNQQRNSQTANIEQARAQLAQTQNQRMQEMLAEANTQLERELGKAWNDETRSALKNMMTEYGFTSDEIANVADARAIKVMFDALKWRQMQAKKPALTKKVQDAPRMAKPGKKPVSPNQAKQDALRSQARKSGSLKDVAALLEMDM